METGDLKMALRAVNHASYIFKDDPRFIILHSRCLRKMDRGSEALELIDQSASFSQDQDLAAERSEVLYELGHYQEYADTMKKAYPQGIPEGTAKLQYIDVLVRLSLFDEALLFPLLIKFADIRIISLELGFCARKAERVSFPF